MKRILLVLLLHLAFISPVIGKTVDVSLFKTMQEAVDILQPGDVLYISGIYDVTSEVSFAGKDHITVMGDEYQSSRISYTGSGGRSVVSLIGARHITFKDIEIHSANNVSPPKAVLILGRLNSSVSYGYHRFERFSVRGYASQALVYSVASEVNSFDNAFFYLDGGGAKYAIYMSEQDDLGLAGLSPSSNLSLWFKHCYIENRSTDVDAAGFYINGRGATGDIVFRDGYIATNNGSAIQINTNSDAEASGPYIFSTIRAEPIGESKGYRYMFRLTKSGNGAAGLYRVFVEYCNSSNPDAAHFMYAENNVNLLISSSHDNSAQQGSSFHSGSFLYMNENYGDIIFRDQANSSNFIGGGSGYKLKVEPSAGNPNNWTWAGVSGKSKTMR
jgi:hypothetical protein